jgi:hypothetical protein
MLIVEKMLVLENADSTEILMVGNDGGVNISNADFTNWINKNGIGLKHQAIYRNWSWKSHKKLNRWRYARQ